MRHLGVGYLTGIISGANLIDSINGAIQIGGTNAYLSTLRVEQLKKKIEEENFEEVKFCLNKREEFKKGWCKFLAVNLFTTIYLLFETV